MQHKGIGLIISNNNHSLFFVQKKDNKYKYEKWRGCYSFWGGEIEPGDLSEYHALTREITEEIQPPDLILNNKPSFVNRFNVNTDEPFLFTLYELVLSDSDFEQLSQLEIHEGLGCVATLEQLIENEWVWGLHEVFRNYSEKHCRF